MEAGRVPEVLHCLSNSLPGYTGQDHCQKIPKFFLLFIKWILILFKFQNPDPLIELTPHTIKNHNSYCTDPDPNPGPADV